MKITHRLRKDNKPLHRVSIKFFIDGDMIIAYLQDRWQYEGIDGKEKFIKKLGTISKIKKDIESKLYNSGINYFTNIEMEIDYEDEPIEIAKKLFPQFYD